MLIVCLTVHAGRIRVFISGGIDIGRDIAVKELPETSQPDCDATYPFPHTTSEKSWYFPIAELNLRLVFRYHTNQ